MENKQKELAGLIKEVTDESISPISKEIEEMKAKAAEQEEANTKLLEDNTELKAKFDAMQDKVITMATKTAGTQQYVFKGYNPELSKNFKSTLSTDECNEVSKTMIDMVKKQEDGLVYKAYDASNAIPVQYGSALMGLAELTSTALQLANVIVADAPVIKLPSKGTREAVDSQAPGTANVVGQQTIGQITWTIDKVVGTYIELLTTQIDDANFDIVNQVIIPMQAEAMGQNFDAEMFNKTEYTSGIVDAPAGVTVSGSVAMAAAITFDNLNTMYHAVEWERGLLNCKWVGSRAALKDIRGLKTATEGFPIFQEVPILGKPSQTLMGSQYVICPSVSDTPANGAIRLAFGDFSKYTIFLRGGTFVSMVNPYIKMKEGYVQFICRSRSDGNIADTASPGSSGAFCTLLRTDA